MSDGSLTSDEIDALLAGVNFDNPSKNSSFTENKPSLNLINDKYNFLKKEKWFYNGDETDLASLGACYALPEKRRMQKVYGEYTKYLVEYMLPCIAWQKIYKAGKNRLEELAVAGALIAIEMDNLMEKDKRNEECKELLEQIKHLEDQSKILKERLKDLNK